MTFQEYFAAKYMVDAVENSDNSEETEERFLYRWSDPWWEEVILLYAGLTTKLPSVLNVVMNPRRNDIYNSNTIFAGRCIAAASIQSQKEAEEGIIQKLFTILEETKQKHLASRVPKR